MKLEIVCAACDGEKHEKDIESMAIYGNRLFSAADDGKVKIWSTEALKLLHEFQAHDYAVNHLLICGDRLYTASADLTIKSWQLDTWKLVTTFTGHEEPPRRLATDKEFIYSGDDKGVVFKWTKDGGLMGLYDVLEEVWDLHIRGNLLYSIRDRGLTVTELKWKKEENKQNIVICFVEGRSPIYLTDKHLLLVDRSGCSIDCYSNTPPQCEFQTTFKGHSKVITALNGWDDNVISVGWDDTIILWDLKSGSQLATGFIPGCPNALVATTDGSIFVGGVDGYIVKLKYT